MHAVCVCPCVLSKVCVRARTVMLSSFSFVHLFVCVCVCAQRWNNNRCIMPLSLVHGDRCSASKKQHSLTMLLFSLFSFSYSQLLSLAALTCFVFLTSASPFPLFLLADTTYKRFHKFSWSITSIQACMDVQKDLHRRRSKVILFCFNCVFKWPIPMHLFAIKFRTFTLN